MNKKVVMGLSGGMDSATLCSYYFHKGYEVFPVSFDYGSKHNQYERKAAERFASHYGLKIQELELPFISQLFKSNLLKTGGEIPEGYYTDLNMSQTVVPARNVIFISIMMGYAWSIGAEIVAVGVHAGDHAIYEDCRAGFIAAMNAAVIQGSGDRVRLETPFQYYDKTKILEIGYDLKTPYQFTRTCYKDQELSCGKCGSCQERLEAFKNIRKEDFIRYEE
jgi:7-cyano-7-deazaguanine synthase